MAVHYRAKILPSLLGEARIRFMACRKFPPNFWMEVRMVNELETSLLVLFFGREL